MKKIIVACLLIFLMPLTAYAGKCGNFSYAELQDMDQEEFLKAYCEVLDIAPTYINVYFYAPRRDKDLYREDANSCSDIMGLMERVYMKRFKPESLNAVKSECKRSKP
ncbi:MAG: hypothetical protein ACYDH8_09735 [Syntrophales bacterium]